MSTVVMRHPTLPPEQEIEVDEGAVPHHTGAGWQIVPAEELAVRAAEKAAALAALRDAEDQSASAAESAAEPSDDKPTPARSRAKSAPEQKGE